MKMELKYKISTPDNKYIEKAFEYLNLHYSEEMQREKLADALKINPDYLGRIFKSSIGKSIKKYSNEIRIKHSTELLAKTDEKIKDIAMNLGFNNSRTFNREFYRVMGVTPSKYRETIRRNSRFRIFCR